MSPNIYVFENELHCMAKKERVKIDHITANILQTDSIKLMDFPRRNMSKVFREFVTWSLKDKARAKALYDKNIPVEIIMGLCTQQIAAEVMNQSLEPMKKALREVLKEKV